MQKVLIAILSYEAEKHIPNVLVRLSNIISISDLIEYQLVLFDDQSMDKTVDVASIKASELGLKLKTVLNVRNLGYGGNQKKAYNFAIENNFDIAVLLHGDNQYPPEMIPNLIHNILSGEADAVFGSRITKQYSALKGGMPLYKFIANKLITQIQNTILGTNLSEFHCGFRAYSTDALRKIPFNLNSNYFDFDTDIIIQLHDNGYKIREIPIPTHYGDEICHVNGPKYTALILLNTIISRIYWVRTLLGINKFNYD